jgi:hypothetical protein
MMLKPFGGDTKVAQILGEQPFGSDFAFAKAILDTTPNKLTLLTPRRELARSWLLLKFKLTTLYGDTGIFVISGKDWQGFQFGDTRATPRTIGDDLYVETGRLEFRFAQGKPDSGMISQSDINRVIQSVHIVRSAPKGPPGSAMK